VLNSGKTLDRNLIVKQKKEMQNLMIAKAREEIHELSQPVTAIMCVLELAKLQGDERSMREGIDHALRECGRVVTSVRRMRTALEEEGQESLI
jgi:signal transduction histidine kinase